MVENKQKEVFYQVEQDSLRKCIVWTYDYFLGGLSNWWSFGVPLFWITDNTYVLLHDIVVKLTFSHLEMEGFFRWCSLQNGIFSGVNSLLVSGSVKLWRLASSQAPGPWYPWALDEQGEPLVVLGLFPLVFTSHERNSLLHLIGFLVGKQGNSIECS